MTSDATENAFLSSSAFWRARILLPGGPSKDTGRALRYIIEQTPDRRGQSGAPRCRIGTEPATEAVASLSTTTNNIINNNNTIINKQLIISNMHLQNEHQQQRGQQQQQQGAAAAKAGAAPTTAGGSSSNSRRQHQGQQGQQQQQQGQQWHYRSSIRSNDIYGTMQMMLW